MLRAQLSNHEQFNAISTVGEPWMKCITKCMNKETCKENCKIKDNCKIKSNLIDEYSLIKNIPREFIDTETEIDIKKLLPKIKFEWEEESLPNDLL